MIFLEYFSIREALSMGLARFLNDANKTQLDAQLCLQ